MKTSDLQIAESAGNGSGSSLRALLNLDWLTGAKAKKAKSKFKAGTHPSAGGQPDGREAKSALPPTSFSASPWAASRRNGSRSSGAQASCAPQPSI